MGNTEKALARAIQALESVLSELKVIDELSCAERRIITIAERAIEEIEELA